MQVAIIAAVMSILELIDLWLGTSLGGESMKNWIETLLMVLTPILVWLGMGTPLTTRR